MHHVYIIFNHIIFNFNLKYPILLSEISTPLICFAYLIYIFKGTFSDYIMYDEKSEKYHFSAPMTSRSIPLKEVT